MRLPQDVANILAIAIRDVVWFKTAVVSLLESCGVPRPIMLEVRKTAKETPTIKIVHHVLDRLAELGDEGFGVARKLLTTLYYWNDFRSIPPDRKDQALASLGDLREAYKRLVAQVEYRQEQEVRMQSARQQEGSFLIWTIKSSKHSATNLMRFTFSRIVRTEEIDFRI